MGERDDDHDHPVKVTQPHEKLKPTRVLVFLNHKGFSSLLRTYSDLKRLSTFKERYDYLKLGGSVGYETFGFDRYLNQRFYNSREWKLTREHVIARDLGCDLGVEGFEINTKVYIHHMNPMTSELLHNRDDSILDPDNLITTTHQTHNAIHFGDESQLPKIFQPRRPGDTRLW